MKLVDIHAHLNFSDFDEDRDAVIAEMNKEGIGAINVGIDKASSAKAVDLCSFDNLWAAIGLHPHNVDEGFDESFYIELAKNKKVVALGECGLDYFRLDDEANKEKQKDIFRQQISLAIKLSLPLMLHIRDSYEDVLAVLADFPEARAHAHFFAGSWAVAKQFLDRGHTLSFTGVITFTTDYDEVIKNIPLEEILIETDSPYVAPAPFRGKRNSPLFVPLVAKRLAEIKALPIEKVLEVLKSNNQRIFGI